MLFLRAPAEPDRRSQPSAVEEHLVYPLSPFCRVVCPALSSPATSSSSSSLYALVGRWREGLSVGSDGCDLPCRHAQPPHAPGRPPRSPPFFAFGWGPVRGRRLGDKSVKGGGTCLTSRPRGGNKALPPTPRQGGVGWRRRPGPHCST